MEVDDDGSLLKYIELDGKFFVKAGCDETWRSADERNIEVAHFYAFNLAKLKKLVISINIRKIARVLRTLLQVLYTAKYI